MFSVVNSSVGAPTGRPKLGNSARWNHPEIGQESWAIPPYVLNIIPMALQMFYGFSHSKDMFYGFVHKNLRFWRILLSSQVPENPRVSSTVGPKELISIGIAIRPWRYRPVAAICTMVKLHGEKRGMVISPWCGILLMTILIPTMDTNGGWIT